jgi:nucleotide-binding universal stress UspA family protein
MKTILVATDFSPASENAMFFAGELAEKMQADIVLLHVYHVLVSMNEVPVLMTPPEDLKQLSDTELGRVKAILLSRFPSANVTTQSVMGEIVEGLRDACDTLKPIAIIIGKHHASGIERFMSDSSSLHIIRHTTIPIIVVPDTVKNYALKNIALAIDGQHPLPQEKIRTLVSAMQAQLHVIHVKTDKNETPQFTELIRGLSNNCVTIQDDEFVHGIENYVRENGVDMILILPHKHSLMERLFFKTHTKELMEKISIPLMCISDEASVDN